MNLASVALTNDHATLSKVSAEAFQYTPGPAYSRELLGLLLPGPKVRTPLINMGYAARVLMIRKSIEEMLDQEGPEQGLAVISLGAGFDNTFHWMCDRFKDRPFSFVEVDTTHVVGRKAELLRSSYGYTVSSISPHKYSIGGAPREYTLYALDLARDFATLCSELSLLAAVTKIWISECVLCYLDRQSADSVLSQICLQPNSRVVLFEQLVDHPYDAFTSCMISHFRRCCSPILSSASVNGRAGQTRRISDLGFSGCSVLSMADFLYSAADVLARMLAIKPFDEWEQLDLFLSHYALTIASNCPSTLPLPEEPAAPAVTCFRLSLQPTFEPHRPQETSHFSCVVSTDGRRIVTGGRRTLSRILDTLSIDSTNVLSHRQLQRYRHQSALYGGRYLVVVGGRYSPGTASMAIVDLEQQSVDTIECAGEAEHLLHRIGHAVAVVDDWIYVFGGLSPTSGQSLPDIRINGGALLQSSVLAFEHFAVACYDADGKELFLPNTRYAKAVAIGQNCVGLLGGLAGFRINDVLLIDIHNKKWCPVLIENRSGHLLLDFSLDADGGILRCTGSPHTVCFSMGSHRDSLWSLDVSPIAFPSTICPRPRFDPSLRHPQVIRIESFSTLPTSLLLDCLSPSALASVHKSEQPDLHFYPQKNFVFETLSVGEFFERLESDSRHWYYFRALSQSNARKKRADFWRDFPALSRHVPKEMFAVPEGAQIHSSVLRISSGKSFSLWLHYDVMSNFLLQIRSKKRVILFPPCDAPYLYMQQSSSVADIGQPSQFPLLRNAHPIVVDLEPGDVLFIPALWFHHVQVPDEDFSVAVNVFWRDLPGECYPQKDLYGNSDLPLEHAPTYPEPFRSFYDWKSRL